MTQIPDPYWKISAEVELPEPNEADYEPFAVYDPD